MGMPGRPKIVSMPLSFSASMTREKPSVSAGARVDRAMAGGRDVAADAAGLVATWSMSSPNGGGPAHRARSNRSSTGWMDEALRHPSSEKEAMTLGFS